MMFSRVCLCVCMCKLVCASLRKYLQQATQAQSARATPGIRSATAAHARHASQARTPSGLELHPAPPVRRLQVLYELQYDSAK